METERRRRRKVFVTEGGRRLIDFRQRQTDREGKGVRAIEIIGPFQAVAAMETFLHDDERKPINQLILSIYIDQCIVLALR